MSAAQTANDLSLAQSYPVEKLRQVLLSRGEWHPFPSFKDRAGWLGLPKEMSAELVKSGEEALAIPLPPLPATLYLGYRREGNRSRFEQVYFARRTQLQNLVLAECVEAKGRFLDAAVNALWSICEESSWCIPAHVGAQKAGVGLPDVAEPIVDLFAAETGVTVSWTLYLLGTELDRVSPRIRPRAELEVTRRILNPVFERDDFGWMALNVTSQSRRPNNWTPWISASVLTTAVTSEADPERRVQIVHKMLRSLDGFLRFHPADGSCDEGPGYWGHAGGSLCDALDLLHSASAGKIDAYKQSLVQEIGRFIYRAHVCGDYWVPVGDCAARFAPERDVIFRYGKRIQDEQLQALAGQGATVLSLLGSRFFGRELNAVFDGAEILALSTKPAPLVRDVWLGSEDLQLMAARAKTGSSEGLYVAAWGGHNAQSHNHNDVGNFIVFANGKPVFVDPGAPTYTAQTFSAKRYDIWAFQSDNHNLPRINGAMQPAGREFAARDVKYESNDTFAQLQLELAPAYGNKAKVSSWRRIIRLNRGKDIEITEDFQLSEEQGSTWLNLMTPLNAEVKTPGVILLHSPEGTSSNSIHIRLEYDAARLVGNVERINLDDARLVKSWGDHLNKLILKPSGPVPLKGTWRLRINEER